MKTQLKKSLTKFSKILKKTLIFLILVLFFFFAIYFLNEYFLVEEIKIKGISQNTSLNGIASYKNRNILFLSEKEIESKITSENSYVDKVYVNKEFPKTLSILVSIHKNIAQLKVSNGFFNLSEEGKSFLFAYEESIGYLTGDFVRDKDAVISAMLIAEMAAYYLNKGLNLLQVLEDLYKNMAITKRFSSLSTWKVQKGRRR